ncbi:MAG: S8 family peptidase [Armatimonadetes bacterium]|nr:S8 family peptidase [Armatimonadota bacterium]
MSEHLQLPQHRGEYHRVLRAGGRGFTRRGDAAAFAERERRRLARIEAEFRRDADALPNYFDPHLIFKVELRDKVAQDQLADFLSPAGIRIISPAPGGSGFWVIMADGASLDVLRQRLARFERADRLKLFNVIERFLPIPPREKIGPRLTKQPLAATDIGYLDVEAWRMPDEQVGGFVDSFSRWLEEASGRVTDSLLTENMCLLRVRTMGAIVDRIVGFREVARIDRPPMPHITAEMLSPALENLPVGAAPPGNATAIAVVDSGIRENHPLLGPAVGGAFAVPTVGSNRIRADQISDDVGHGTKVAGVALYGDLRKCVLDGRFDPRVWIVSAKVMYAVAGPDGQTVASFDPEELLEHQLQRAVEQCVRDFPGCRIVNLSLGSDEEVAEDGSRQFALATLIDELAHKHKLIFVISAGNVGPRTDNYPDYLVNDTADARVINPGTAAYALTVGSVAPEYGPSDLHPQDILASPADSHHPSPFTRCGPGYHGMIKPELVEVGGNVIRAVSGSIRADDMAGKVIVLNPEWLSAGRLLTVDYGTSYSAPKVAHDLARLLNRHPTYDFNLAKALMLASAGIPSDRPGVLSNYRPSGSQGRALLNIYGYGLPSPELAIESMQNEVLLLAQNTIGLDKWHLYYFFLPDEFVQTPGKREIRVSLVYNPPVRRDRIEYLGVSMEYHLFRNADVDEVVAGYGALRIEDTDAEAEIVPASLKPREIPLWPGVTIRKRGLHQCAGKPYVQRPDIDTSKPLVLAVASQNRWRHLAGWPPGDFQQSYAAVALVKHEAQVDLYSRIRDRIRERPRVRVR